MCAWLGIFLYQSQPWLLLQDFGAFAFLGVLGAIFANATGAGGGVVFMPFFKQLDFNVVASVATSFAIQCCGMTAGALTWYGYFKKLIDSKTSEANEWQLLPNALWLIVPPSIFGLWCVQYNEGTWGQLTDADTLHTGFGVFSVCLSIAIMFSVLFFKKQLFKQSLTLVDKLALIAVSFVGGGITAWLSIGVGELLAVYLIMRGFNVAFAIASAVIVSAFTVWAGVIFHLAVTEAVNWSVVLFAGAGAIIGGVLAKRLVLYFSPQNLKLFFAGWIFILGVTSLPL